MAPHSSSLARKIPWMEEPGGLQSMGSLGVGHNERLHFHFSLSCIGEGNGNPLQCSCLENPRDGGAWWAAVYRVTQSRTRLKRLSSNNFTLIFPWGFKLPSLIKIAKVRTDTKTRKIINAKTSRKTLKLILSSLNSNSSYFNSSYLKIVNFSWIWS